jgi:hypothetical protein
LDLCVTVEDPFLLEEDVAGHPIHLWGEVSTDGIRVHYKRSGNYFSSTPWLAPDQKDAVLAILNRCMEPWFAYWSKPSRLIEYFLDPPDMVTTKPAEGGVEHRVGKHKPWTPPTPLAAAMAGEIAWAKGAPRDVRSPQEIYLLSILYYHLGDPKASLIYAKRHLDSVRDEIQPAAEPERTLRHISALSSA